MGGRRSHGELRGPPCGWRESGQVFWVAALGPQNKRRNWVWFIPGPVRRRNRRAPLLCNRGRQGHPNLTAHLPPGASFPVSNKGSRGPLPGNQSGEGTAQHPLSLPHPRGLVFKLRQEALGGPGGLWVPGSHWAHEQEERPRGVYSPAPPNPAAQTSAASLRTRTQRVWRDTKPSPCAICM